MGKHQSKHSSPETINRQALGRIAKLGDLYDATTDKFCGISIFKKQLPPDSPAITRTDSPDSKTSYIKIRCLKEMFSELNVTGDLKLSVLAGMCELEGSAKYLSQKKTNFCSVECTLLHNVKTVTERLEIFDDQVKRYLSRRAISYSGATHVVVEIEWGASCAITAANENRENSNKQEVEGSIRLVLDKLMSFIMPHVTWQAGAQYTPETTTGNLERFSLKIFGDVILPEASEDYPTDFDSAVKMMKKVPQMIQNYNDGKGKPVGYVMFPIAHLVSKIPSKRLTTFRKIDDQWITKTVRLFDDIQDIRERVRDEIEELNHNEQINQNDLHDAQSLAKEFELHEAMMKSELATLLEKIRSGKEDAGHLHDFCSKHEETAQRKVEEFRKFIAKPSRSISQHQLASLNP